MKTALLASALALAMTTAGIAQTSSQTTPGMNNPASSGKAGSPMTSETTKSSTTGMTGNSMSNPNGQAKTPGGETGPSSQTSKPK